MRDERGLINWWEKCREKGVRNKEEEGNGLEEGNGGEKSRRRMVRVK